MQYILKYYRHIKRMSDGRKLKEANIPLLKEWWVKRTFDFIYIVMDLQAAFPLSFLNYKQNQCKLLV